MRRLNLDYRFDKLEAYPTFDKLEAYPTFDKLEAYPTFDKLEAYPAFDKLEAYPTKEFPLKFVWTVGWVKTIFRVDYS